MSIVTLGFSDSMETKYENTDMFSLFMKEQGLDDSPKEKRKLIHKCLWFIGTRKDVQQFVSVLGQNKDIDIEDIYGCTFKAID